MEVFGYAANRYPPNTSAPVGWRTDNSSGFGDPLGAACRGARWPYDPRRPDSAGPAIATGDYVDVIGALVTENAHIGTCKPRTLDLCRNDIQNVAVALCREGESHFCGNATLDEMLALKVWGDRAGDDGIWTEMHPPDAIHILSPLSPGNNTTSSLKHPAQLAPAETFRAVAVASDNCAVWPCRVSEASFDLYPAGPRPAGSRVAFTEEVSSASTLSTLVEANTSRTGALVVGYADHVHIKVAVRGEALWGIPGRFEAFYRVFWK
jgi:hypothetical protein